VYKLCARAALSKSSVMILGETGTGKTFVARTIHENSSSSQLPLKKLGAEMKDEVWIRELSQTTEGSIMVEEIESLSAEKQAALSQFLDEKESERASVRIFSLSHLPLKSLQQESHLKSELFYRLSTITVELPPLRERKEDLAELIHFYLEKISSLNERRLPRLSSEALVKLENNVWPGNLRELEQVLERAVALSNSDSLEPEDFPLSPSSNSVGSDLKSGEPSGVKELTSSLPPLSSLESMEREHISRVLEEVHYNKTKAAETLGIDRATLYRKCKTYGINLKEGKV
ncbi:MAG: sigma-54-dependent Fis family transcriptional regulator, partial [Proteobacteria bacterium]